MGIGAGLFLIAAGAILVWGVDAGNTSGLNVDAIGVILMLVGLSGILISLLFWSSWGAWGTRRRTIVDGYTDDVVVRELAPRRRTRLVEDHEVESGPPPPPA